MRKSICITYYTFPHVGGISSIIDDLWEFFSDKYDTYIFAYKSEGVTSKYGNYLYNFDHMPQTGVLVFPFIWFYICFMSYKLWRLQRKHNFKFILAQDGFCSGLFSLIVGRLTGTRVIIMDHGVVTNILDPFWQTNVGKALRNPRSIIRVLFFPFSKLSYKIIIWLVCKYGQEFFFFGRELEDLYKKYNIPESKLKRYKHLVNTKFFIPLSPEEKVKEKQNLGIKENDMVINMITRLDVEKGFEYVLPALREIMSRRSNDFIILVAGKGRLRKQIEDYIKENKLNEHIKLLGPLDREKVRRLLQASDIHLYAGTMGCSISIALLEAMACGCVPIVTSVPEMHKYIITPEMGWVVPPKDIQALVNALWSALSLKDKLIQMGRNARKYIENNHSFEVASKYFILEQ